MIWGLWLCVDVTFSFENEIPNENHEEFFCPQMGKKDSLLWEEIMG